MTLIVPDHLKRGGVRENSAESGLDAFRIIAEALDVDTSWLAGREMLDVGCGNRLAEAVIAYQLPLKRYVGLDNARKLIEALAPQVQGTNVELALIPVFNARYAQDAGERLSRDYALPVRGAFDIIHAWSLFSHLTAEDTDAYFHILRRHARERAAFLFTAFLEANGGWRDDSDPAGPPLLRVRYDPSLLDRLLREAGWTVERVYARRAPPLPWPSAPLDELTGEPGGQSLLVCRPI